MILILTRRSHDESERWKIYRESLWRYLRFIQETRRQKNARNENENAEDNAKRDISADNENANSVLYDLTQTSNVLTPHSITSANMITKNFEISSEHNHAMKSIEEIVEIVPKSYRKHLLMKHLFRKAVPNRINWNEHEIVT